MSRKDGITMVGCPTAIKESGSVEARLDYFNTPDLVVNHPELDRVVERLMWASKAVNDQNMLVLVGPTGVGKTAALKLTVAKMNASIDSGADPDQQSVPAMIVEAEASEDRRFDYKHFYASVLALAGEVAINRSLPLIARKAGPSTLVTVDPRSISWLSPVSALRMRVQNTLIQRRILLLAVDEAVNLLLPANPKSEAERRRKIVSNAAIVRSLVNKSPTCLVLAGAYDFFDLTTKTGQLARRGDVVPFREYRPTKTGLTEFFVGWLSLVMHLPIQNDLDDETYAAEVFSQCCGCIGVAKTILGKGLLEALRTGKRLTQTLVRGHYYARAALQRMQQEIVEGSNALDALNSCVELRVDDDPVQVQENGTLSAALPVRGIHKRGVGEMNPRRSFVDPT